MRRGRPRHRRSGAESGLGGGAPPGACTSGTQAARERIADAAGDGMRRHPAPGGFAWRGRKAQEQRMAKLRRITGLHKRGPGLCAERRDCQYRWIGCWRGAARPVQNMRRRQFRGWQATAPAAQTLPAAAIRGHVPACKSEAAPGRERARGDSPRPPARKPAHGVRDEDLICRGVGPSRAVPCMPLQAPGILGSQDACACPRGRRSRRYVCHECPEQRCGFSCMRSGIPDPCGARCDSGAQACCLPEWIRE